jgi:serine/threonine protein kinase
LAKARFQIVEVIGAGRWGVVCVALDTSGRHAGPVALKVMLQSVASDKRSAARARDEARILKRVRHVNLVEVREAVELDGRPVIIMEWVDGCNLEELLAQRPRGIPPHVALAIARQIALGLDSAWTTMQVLHRDLKPANVMLSVDGVVKVADFGLARAEFDEREAYSLQGELVMGSRAYTSPERADGDTEETLDVYSLGLVLLELLTGQRHVFSFLPRRHQMELDAWFTRSAVPPDIEALLRAMLSFEAAARPTMAATVERLTALLPEGHAASLLDFTHAVVHPLRAAREVVGPEDHPAWAELVGVGDPLGARGRKLERAKSPESVAAHLDTIDRASRAWWDMWSRTASQESVILSISALKGTQDPKATARFRALALHPDRAIAAAARGAIADED